MRVSRLRVGFQVLLHVLLVGHVLAFYYLDWTAIGALDFQAFFHHLLGEGLLTAGALLTAAMFLLACVFGRLFCSWGCHFGATQDLAAWLLRRIGWKPPFVKTRFLHLTPYALLVAVFLLPPFASWLRSGWGPLRVDYGAVRPWETLPGWFLSIVTFLACGAGILLFLGTRGFCRFVCPYGAVFRLTDKVTPFRVRRTAPCGSACTDSGLHPCTAACPTAVDVHGETSRRGKVVNSDCVRCHLCIEACPSGALAYAARAAAPAALVSSVPAAGGAPAGPAGFRPLGIPVLAAMPAARDRQAPYTLPVWGEVAVLLVGLATYLACDEVYGAHFLAATMALGEGFLAYLVIQAVTGDVGATLLGRPLRRGRAWTFLGITLAGALALSIFPLFEAGAFKLLCARAARLDPAAPRAALLAGSPIAAPEKVTYSPEARLQLAAAAEHYRRALDYFPSDLRIRRLLLSVLVRLKDPSAVAEAEELARRSPPLDEDARQALLWVYERYGENTKARELREGRIK